jgi:anti-sigma factor RsiW
MNCNDIAELSPLYLSGELDAPRAAPFAAHLKACPSCALEIERQRELDARLREGVLASEPATGALDSRIRQRISAERRSKTARWVLAAASVAAILLIVGLGLRMLPTHEPLRVCADAARDHRNEIVLRQPRTWIRDQSGIQAIAARLSLSPSAIPSFAAAGYHLERGKLCRLDGRAFLHLVYSNGAGEFSFFVRPRDHRTSSDIYTQGIDREYVALVESGNLTAMVVTEQAGDAALNLARSASGAL